MAKQIQKTKAVQSPESTQGQEVQAKDQTDQSLKDATDALLDEIDALLEPNAEEFVKAYVQKGGQ